MFHLRRYRSGTSGTESCEGCLWAQFKHSPPQRALRLSLARLQKLAVKIVSKHKIFSSAKLIPCFLQFYKKKPNLTITSETDISSHRFKAGCPKTGKLLLLRCPPSFLTDFDSGDLKTCTLKRILNTCNHEDWKT